MRAALFDMDRTLVRKETATLYVRYQHAIGEATRRDLLRALYWVTQYTMGLIDAPAVAARALRTLEGTAETTLSARMDDWFRRYVETHVCDLGRRAVLSIMTRSQTDDPNADALRPLIGEVTTLVLPYLSAEH